MKSLTGALLVSTLLSVSNAAQALVYSVDDGTAENRIGLTGAGMFTFGNHFVAAPGGTTITDISIVWGRPGATTTNGLPVTATLWSDPNGDGNPSDALPLSSIVGVTSNADTNTFVVYDIPDVTLAIGQSFFVGGTVTLPSAQNVVGLDTNPPISNESWAAVGPTFATAFNVGTASSVELMVRANGISAVPEPGSLALLAVALGAFGLGRRRRQPE